MTKSCYETLKQKTPNGFPVKKDDYIEPKTRQADYIHNTSNDIKVSQQRKQVNNTYYYNTAQRLRAKNLSYERNLPSQKNSQPCCSDEKKNCHPCCPGDTCCYRPINKQQYGTKCKCDGTVPVGSSSGARTFALSQISNTVKKDIKIIDNSNKLWYQKSCPTQKRCYFR